MDMYEVSEWVEELDDGGHVEQYNELHEKISNLLSVVQKKDSDIIILKNKLASTVSMLDIVTKEQELEHTTTTRRKKCAKTLAKFEFYKLHKDDEQVAKDVATFKKTFPHLKVTWQFRKSITDSMFAKG
jgi:site-specific recombinase